MRLPEFRKEGERMGQEKGWQSFSHSCIHRDVRVPVPVASQTPFQVLGKQPQEGGPRERAGGCAAWGGGGMPGNLVVLGEGTDRAI